MRFAAADVQMTSITDVVSLEFRKPELLKFQVTDVVTLPWCCWFVSSLFVTHMSSKQGTFTEIIVIIKRHLTLGNFSKLSQSSAHGVLNMKSKLTPEKSRTNATFPRIKV